MRAAKCKCESQGHTQSDCLYAKELVLRNFIGLPADQLLERMVELSSRTEEHL